MTGELPDPGPTDPATVREVLHTAGSHPILQGFPGGAIVVFDHDLRFLAAGGLGLAEVGLSRELLEGRTIGEVFPPEVVELIRPHYDRALAGEGSHLYVTYGGREYLNQLGPLRDGAGSVIAGMGFTHDVTDVRQSQTALQEESRRLRDAESIGRVGSWEIDLRTQKVTWSDGIFDLYGLDRSGFDVDYAAAIKRIHPDDRDDINAAVEDCAANGVPMRGRYRVNRADNGELRWIETRGEALYEDGQRVRIVGAIADVTEHILGEWQVRNDQAFQRAVIEASPDIIFVYDLSTRTTTWSNRSQLAALGYADDATAGATVAVDQFIPDEDRSQFDAAIAEATEAEPGAVVQINHRMLAADGSQRWFSRRMAALGRDGHGRVTALVGVQRDITEALATEQQLRYSALHDSLTGLPNRALLIDRLDVALTRVGHSRRVISLLFCDLDGFKRINDTSGHAAGDQVLLEIARRMQSVLREGDTVARIGGDEFVLVVEPWNRSGSDDQSTPEQDRAAATRIAERIREAVRAPVPVNGVDHLVSVSIGIAFGPYVPPGQNTTVTSDQLLLDADTAMYRAKGRGRDRFEVFDQTMRTDGAERNRVEQALRTALQHNGICSCDGSGTAKLSAAYQPIFAGDGALVGVEALARLVDARGAAIEPGAFIVIAEESGLVAAVDMHVMHLACRQLRTWRTEEPAMRDVVMSVNVSALHAQHSSLSDDIHCALERHELSPGDLTLELTETALLDAAHSTITALRNLHEEGVGIAIDDFGTGYASLRYLLTLPISMLKIDRSFTAGLPGDETSRKIVAAVAGLAADLALSCVVEGVETREQQQSLPDWVQLQGYLLGRPLAADDVDLEAWLTGNRS